MAIKQKTRNVALTPHLDRFVQTKIDSGRYQSASEVVRESLRQMEQQEQDRRETLAQVRDKIHVGYEQLRRGDTLDADDVLAEIKAMSQTTRKRKAVTQSR